MSDRENVGVTFDPNDEGTRNLIRVLSAKYDSDPASILSALLTPLALVVAYTDASVKDVRAALDQFVGLAKDYVAVQRAHNNVSNRDEPAEPIFKSKRKKETDEGS